MQVPPLERRNFFRRIDLFIKRVVFWRDDDFKSVDIFDNSIFQSDNDSA